MFVFGYVIIVAYQFSSSGIDAHRGQEVRDWILRNKVHLWFAWEQSEMYSMIEIYAI
jgi:hypothetical protein